MVIYHDRWSQSSSNLLSFLRASISTIENIERSLCDASGEWSFEFCIWVICKNLVLMNQHFGNIYCSLCSLLQIMFEKLKWLFQGGHFVGLDNCFPRYAAHWLHRRKENILLLRYAFTVKNWNCHFSSNAIVVTTECTTYVSSMLIRALRC